MDNIKHIARNDYHIEQKRNKCLIYIIVDGKKEYIGYVKYRILKHTKDDKYIHIDLITIDQQYRRQGYATALFDFLYKKYPDLRIELRYLTPQGMAFFNQILAYYPTAVMHQ